MKTIPKSFCVKYYWIKFIHSVTVYSKLNLYTVNDLFRAPALVTAPYLFSWQYNTVTASIMQRTCSCHSEKKNISCISFDFCS